MARLSLREQGYLFLNEPASGRFAYWFGRLMQVLLILSSLATTYETVTWVNSATGPAVWLYTKLIFNCIFTVEALLRIMTFTPFHAVHKSLFVWLDLLTVAPLWIRFAVLPQSMTVAEYLNKMGGITIRGIEALAAFRIFKLCRYFEGASILAISVGRAMSQLLVPLFMLTLMVLGFAAILFEIEYDSDVHACNALWMAEGVDRKFLKANPHGVVWDCSVCATKSECLPDDAECASLYDYRCLTCAGYPTDHPECKDLGWGQTFPDIPRSMWFMFVTVSTVGYGDVTPKTWQGQIFVCVTIICGLIFIAMPLAIVGSTFGRVWDERQLLKLQHHLRQLLAENGIDPNDAALAFKKMDTSGDGSVSFSEFQDFIVRFKMSLEAGEVKELWKALDVDGSGRMSLEEFIGRAYPGIDLSTVEGSHLHGDAEAEAGKMVHAERKGDFEALHREHHKEILGQFASQALVQQARADKFEGRLADVEQMVKGVHRIMKEMVWRSSRRWRC